MVRRSRTATAAPRSATRSSGPARAAGARIAFDYKSETDRAEQTAAAIRAAGSEAIVLRGDTGDPAHVEDLANRAVEAWGGIDIWVNNAARLMVKPFLELTGDDWHGL